MNRAQKIISNLPLIDTNGLDWNIEIGTTFIQSYQFEVEAGEYLLEVDTYLERLNDRTYARANKIVVYENTNNGYALIYLTDAEHEAVAMAINDNI